MNQTTKWNRCRLATAVEGYLILKVDNKQSLSMEFDTNQLTSIGNR